jgi:hypothetical protein
MAREDGFFDDLARGLADGSLTRGKALRLMGAALVGGALGSVGIGEASADPPGCKRNGKKCKKDSSCCSGQCVNGVCSGGEPICNPPCPEGRECLEVEPGATVCYPICTPSCTPGTACYANQDGTTTFCVCGFGQCTDDCSVCSSIGLTCALADPIAGCGGARFQCVTPVGVGVC